MAVRITASIGPDGTYTRHSEGSFAYSAQGSIVFIYSRFMGGKGDDAPSDLVRIESTDGGESWSGPETVIRAKEFGVSNVMSVSLLAMQNGDIGCFFIVKRAPGINEVHLSRSKDGCRTFYSDRECTLEDRRGYYVLNNDRVERLASGRLILPLTFHRGGYSSQPPRIYFDGRGTACFLISDDDGDTWHEAADEVFAPFTGTSSGLQENGAAELRPGLLLGYSRTDQMCQYIYRSFDDGEHWMGAEPSRFSSPCSPMRIRRRPGTSEVYAVWNPIPGYNGRISAPGVWARTPIVYSVSRDGGMTWEAPSALEQDETHGYCYPAIFFTREGKMLVSYCAGGPEDGICLARTNIAIVDL